jgi:hypothetical protein
VTYHEPEEAPTAIEAQMADDEYDVVEPLSEEEIEDAIVCYGLMDKLDATSKHWQAQYVKFLDGRRQFSGELFLRENESHPHAHVVQATEQSCRTAWLAFEADTRREVLSKMVQALDEIVTDLDT